MMQMLGTFLGLVMALVLGTANQGKPETTPVMNQEGEVLGNMVSEQAKNIGEENQKNETSGEGTNFQEKVSLQDGDLYQYHYADDKVPAYNNKSEKVMPTLIPQVAVDKSPALEEYSEENGQEPDPLNDNQPQGVVQTHAQFGLSVANNQPDEAKENKAAFGEETSQNAQENKRQE